MLEKRDAVDITLYLLVTALSVVTIYELTLYNYGHESNPLTRHYLMPGGYTHLWSATTWTTLLVVATHLLVRAKTSLRFTSRVIQVLTGFGVAMSAGRIVEILGYSPTTFNTIFAASIGVGIYYAILKLPFLNRP